MNKYILSKGNTTIKLNTDTLDVDYLETLYDINRMYFIEEDGIFVRENKEYEVKRRYCFTHVSYWRRRKRRYHHY